MLTDKEPERERTKVHFEQNMLGGDKVQLGQMLSSESVLEYLLENYILASQATAAQERAIVEIEKAYGGCHNCYGKGYASYLTAHSGRGYYKKVNYPVFCECDRGKQLEKMIASLHQGKDIEESRS